MRPRRTYESDSTLDLPGGNEDNSLWFQHAVDGEDGHVFVSTWVPTEEERQLIIEGWNIELRIYGKGHPPVSMGLNEQRLGKRPEGDST